MQGIELVAGELGSAGECAVGVFLEKLIDRVVEAVGWPPCAGSHAARKPHVRGFGERELPISPWRPPAAGAAGSSQAGPCRPRVPGAAVGESAYRQRTQRSRRRVSKPWQRGTLSCDAPSSPIGGYISKIDATAYSEKATICKIMLNMTNSDLWRFFDTPEADVNFSSGIFCFAQERPTRLSYAREKGPLVMIHPCARLQNVACAVPF